MHRQALAHVLVSHSQELERAISKHEIIGVKALAQRTQSINGGDGRAGGLPARSSTHATGSKANQSQSRRALADFKRSIRETESEAAATRVRLQELLRGDDELRMRASEAAEARARLQQRREAAASGAAGAVAARCARKSFPCLYPTCFCAHSS